MIQYSSKILQPYFKAACEPDWFKPLQALVERTPLSELPGIRQHAEDAAEQCGFCIQGGQKYLTRIYLRRIRQMCHRRLLNLNF